MSLKKRLGFTTEPVYLMDGTAFIYRGFFANAAMTRSDGFPTGALYIVGRVLLKLIREERPTHFGFIMDGKGPHFRHELFSAYKANRPPTPEALLQQIAPIQRMVQALGIHVEVSENCEADDCLASLAARFSPERPVIIVGVDKDLRQCLRPNVVLWDPASREEKLVTLDSFAEESGLQATQWPDVQALIGDSSDNVPGIRGIGEKTAQKLFQSFTHLEDLYQALDAQHPDIGPSVRKKLEGTLEAALLYRQLTTLSLSSCPQVNLDTLTVQSPAANAALTLFREFEMGSLHRDLSELIRKNIFTVSDQDSETASSPRPPSTASPSPKGQQQLNLFDAAPAPELPPLQEITSAQALPLCAGFQVALTPPPPVHGKAMPGLVLAVADTAGVLHPDLLYTGPVPALFEHLQQASLLVCPDLKQVFRQHPQVLDLPFLAELVTRSFDLGLAAYLLAPEDRDYGWPRLCAQHAALSGLSPFAPATLALSLHSQLASSLEAMELTHLFHSLEMPLILVLAHMEAAGIAIDLAELQRFLAEVQNNLDTLTARIYEAAGGDFNIRSAQQIGEILFKRLGLPGAKNTKGGQASTSQDVLEKLSGHHPVVDALLEFRKLEKLRSTYLEPLPRLCDTDGRIRTTFNQCATATGRLSSSNPNLQNIPVRGTLGQRMRICFTAKPGHSLVSADYSQIELRVLAHYSQDPTLLEAFRNAEDIHTRTAALLHDLPPAEINHDQRRSAKTINFGLLYGMGARKLSQELAISLAEAKDFIDRYFARFSHIKAFYDSVEAAARTQGYVVTLAGRRRPLPDMHSLSPQARALAERQAVNTLIQGSAADIIKLAMLATQADATLHSAKAQLILQIHDELILEVPSQEADLAGNTLATLMSTICPLSVPLSVDWGQGPTWGSAH